MTNCSAKPRRATRGSCSSARPWSAAAAAPFAPAAGSSNTVATPSCGGGARTKMTALPCALILTLAKSANQTLQHTPCATRLQHIMSRATSLRHCSLGCSPGCSLRCFLGRHPGARRAAPAPHLHAGHDAAQEGLCTRAQRRALARAGGAGGGRASRASVHIHGVRAFRRGGRGRGRAGGGRGRRRCLPCQQPGRQHRSAPAGEGRAAFLSSAPPRRTHRGRAGAARPRTAAVAACTAVHAATMKTASGLALLRAPATLLQAPPAQPAPRIRSQARAVPPLARGRLR
jgi:hypothetical protein